VLIGLISDTHVRIPGHNVSLSTLISSELPPQVIEAFKGVDLILHAGDIYSLPVLDDLEAIAPVLAAEGDDDPFDTTIDRRVKPTQTITVDDVTIWMSHYGEWTGDYPFNPNGSIEGVAGICDESGRLFGMMPHPEGYLHYTNHPRWTRECLPEEGAGVTLFRNAAEYVRDRLTRGLQ